MKTNCERCLKEIDTEKALSREIWYRTREWRESRGKLRYTAVNKKRKRYFCSGKCAGDQQMAMEG